MAGYSRYTVVLDACVLYPAPLRDLLLSLASEGIFRARDFLIAQYDLDPLKILSIIKAKRERLKNPPRSAEELILTYELQGLPQICAILRQAADLI